MYLYLEEIFIIILLLVNGISSLTKCTTDLEFGKDKPESKDDELDSEIGTAIMMFHDEFQFGCCGFVYTWEIAATDTYTSGTVDAQVWRHVSGNSYELVGANTLTPKNPGKDEEHPITNGQRIRVKDNDYIGMHSTGGFIITSKKEGKGQDRLKLTGVTSSMTSPYDWTSASNDDMDYAINAWVTPSKQPSITALTDVTFYNDESLIGDVIKTVVVTDPDKEDISSLIVTIQSATISGTNYFEIASGSRDVTVKAAPPINAYTLTLKVEDPCTQSSTSSFKVTILNRLPVIHNLPATVSMSEDEAYYQLIVINATDTVTDPVTCSLGAGDATKFRVRPVGGLSTDYQVNSRFDAVYDYDVQSTFVVTVTCDDGDDTVSADLTINLIANTPPTINNIPASSSISEDLNTRKLLHTINVTDVEGNAITCSLSPTSSLYDVAIIPPTTDYGVYLTGGITLDYDTTSSYVVSVDCADNRGSDTEDFTVNLIRNIPPVINSLPEITSISEDLNSRTLLHTINVTDAEGDTLICVLQTHTSIFEVVNDLAGGAYGIYLSGGTTLDYDTVSSYVLTVECSDHRRGDTKSLTVDLIRNTPPVTASLPAISYISEDVSTRTLLHTLNITDVDVTDVHTCSLVSPSSTFEVVEINPSSGQYGVFMLSGITLDYDTTPSYTVSVICSDHRRGDTRDLTVDVIRNEPPTIINLPMSVAMSEDTTAEILLYTVSSTDPTNDTVTCSITSTTTKFFLQIGANQYEYGVYTTSNVAFSYDTQKSYTIDIVCADLRRNDTSSLYVYLIRNMPPQFKNLQGQTIVPALTTTAGQVVYTVTGTDPENDALQYTIISTNHPFTINQNTGEISLSRSIKTESVTGYDLSITVFDGQNTVGPETLTIIITGINSPPSLTNLPMTLSLLENVAVDTTVFQVQVKDFNLADTHTFSVIYSPPDGAVYFDVNKTDGRVTPVTTIDYETISSKTFSLLFTVSDSLMEDNGTLAINIIDVNEAPKFTKKDYAFSTTEATEGTVLQNPYYQYTDQDGDTMKFTCNCGSETGWFDMNSATGFFSYSIDYDLDVTGTPALLQCVVTINDGEYSDTANVNITVLDDNDNSPQFQHTQYTFFVPIAATIGTTIGGVTATDGDTGNNGVLHYHVEQGTIESGVFDVSDDGTITTKQLLTSYTEGTVLEFTIYAVDAGGRQDDTNIMIVIPDLSVDPITVDDTIRYMTFFTYAPNMAWFVPACFAVFIAACAVAHILWTAKCNCKLKKRSKRRIRRPRQRQHHTTGTSHA